MSAHRDAAIDELRGLAFLAVLASHVGLIYGLDLDLAYAMAMPAFGVGVDLFFVISGYVITRNLLELRERAGGDIIVSTAAFWMRRVIRIGPPLWVTAAAIAVARLALPPAGSLADLIAGAGFFSDFYWAECMTRGTSCPSPLIASHFWSVGLEMQFYALAPFVIALRRALAIACLVGILIAGAVAARPVGGYLWSVRPDALLLGVALAGEGARDSAWLGRLPRVGLVQAAYWLVIAAVVARIAASELSGLAIVVTAAICAYVVATRIATGAHAGWWARWLQNVGMASYGAYLVHLPILSAVHALLSDRASPVLSLGAALACVGIATALTQRLIVQPAATAGRRWSDAFIIKNCKQSGVAYKRPSIF
ncbi:MAG: acyltransferase [Hyphomicrobiales bacterium]|nr:acyltransferase [Hyphomicrobiales bacterium]